jgi:hypothetical protein
LPRISLFPDFSNFGQEKQKINAKDESGISISKFESFRDFGTLGLILEQSLPSEYETSKSTNS